LGCALNISRDGPILHMVWDSGITRGMEGAAAIGLEDFHAVGSGSSDRPH